MTDNLRDIDVALAEKLFGIKWVELPMGYYEAPGDYFSKPIRFYSINPAASETVIDKMIERGFAFERAKGPQDESHRARFYFDEGRVGSWPAFDAVASVAVARAALAALSTMEGK